MEKKMLAGVAAAVLFALVGISGSGVAIDDQAPSLDGIGAEQRDRIIDQKLPVPPWAVCAQYPEQPTDCS